MEDRGEIEGIERKKETLLTEANQIEETERKETEHESKKILFEKNRKIDGKKIIFERKQKDRWKENTLD